MGGIVYRTAMLISSTDVYAWDSASISSGEAGILDFLDAQERQRDFLLLGAGAALVFPSAAFRGEIDRRSMGLETMDTSAACRTYNILVAEGRTFTAALLPPGNVRGAF
jgi:uncharacterized protein